MNHPRVPGNLAPMRANPAEAEKHRIKGEAWAARLDRVRATMGDECSTSKLHAQQERDFEKALRRLETEKAKARKRNQLSIKITGLEQFEDCLQEVQEMQGEISSRIDQAGQSSEGLLAYNLRMAKAFLYTWPSGIVWCLIAYSALWLAQ